MSLQEAKAKGATALFGEKYGDVVRVVQLEDYSMELCGGTHLTAAGEIGEFKIISEGSIAAGVRRIEALTGEAAYLYTRQMEDELSGVADLLRVKPTEVATRIELLLQQNRELERQIAQGEQEQVAGKIKKGIPLKRYGTPLEVAQLMLYLASDESLFCTGGVFVVDGGISAR